MPSATRVLRILNRLNIGGPTYNAVYLTQYLAPAFETKLAAGTIDPTEGDSSFIATERGIQPVIVPEMARAIRPMADRRAYRFLRRLIREFKPTIVHTHAAKAGALGRLAAVHEQVPVVVHTFHGHVFHSYFSPLKTRVFLEIERYLARKSSGIVAISQLQLQELTQVYRIAPSAKFHVIPNGFELAKFSADWAEKRAAFHAHFQLPQGKVMMGIVGRLVPVKNHGLFLEAFAKLKAQTPVPIHGVIIGDGELRAEVEGTARRLGLRFAASDPGRDLTFTSWVPHIETAYPGLDILALTSHNEGTPVSLVEAQAAGIPVVSTDVGGVRETLQDGTTGYAIPPGQVEPLVNRLQTLVENEVLRAEMGAAGKAFVQAHYGVERLAADMAALYDRLLSK